MPIQEYSDTHVYTTIYDQGSFKPVARLAWLRNDIPQVANDELEAIQDNPHLKKDTKPKSKIEVYHYHNDQLGTPNELTNDKGEVIWLADYEAWGNAAKVIWREQVIDRMQVSQDELQPIRFQGQIFDEETGLHYNRFRYYDPDMGMFTTRDPIGLMGGDNLFQYAPNSTGWVDPLGLKGNAIVGRPPVYSSGTPGYNSNFLKEVGRGMNIIKCGSGMMRPCGVKVLCNEYWCPNDPPPDNQCRAFPKPKVHRITATGVTFKSLGCKCIDKTPRVVKEEDAPR